MQMTTPNNKNKEEYKNILIQDVLDNPLRKKYSLNILFGDQTKNPRVKNWNKWCDWHDQDDYEIIDFFNKRKGDFTNYGFAVRHNGLVGLDFDWEWLYHRAKGKHLSLIENTFTARTPNGGYRVLVICPDYEKNNSQYKNKLRFDIFGDKHYVACYGEALKEDDTIGEYKPIYEDNIKMVDSLNELESFLEDTLKLYDFLTYPCISSFFSKQKKWIHLTNEQRLAICNLELQQEIPVNEAQRFFMMCKDDYGESISTYQCEHTQQKIENGALNPPTCATLKTIFGYDGNKCNNCPRKKKEKIKNNELRIINNIKRQINSCPSGDYKSKVKTITTQLSTEQVDPNKLDYLICQSFPEIQAEDITIAKNIISKAKSTYAKQWKQIKENENEEDDNPIAEVLDNLCVKYKFITAEDTDEIYFYSQNEGIYKSGEVLIKKEVEDTLNNKATTKIVNEVLNHIRRRSYIPRERINEEGTKYLPVQNGLFNLDTYLLENFTADKIFTYKLPFKYDPTASYEGYKPFIQQILAKEDIPVIQQFFGYCFLPSLPVHKSLWLHGTGRNGKTQLTLILKKTLGDENVTSVGIEEFDGYHRFAVARLYSKLLNLISEPATQKTMRSVLFKRAVGGDSLSAEIKNAQKTLDFTNYAKFIILGNEFPEVEDTSIAFWDRLIVIGFPNSFIDNFIPEIGLKLIEENGLSAFFNWCLEGLKQLKANNFHFSTSKSSEDMKLEFEKLSNPIMAFIKERCIVGVDYIISVTELYEYYKDYCDDENIEIVGKGELSKKVGELRGVSKTKTRYGSEKKIQWCWRGIEIRPQIEEIGDIEEKELENNDEEAEHCVVDNVDIVDALISKPHVKAINTFIDNSNKGIDIGVGIKQVNNVNNVNNYNIGKKHEEKPIKFVNINDLDKDGNIIETPKKKELTENERKHIQKLDVNEDDIENTLKNVQIYSGTYRTVYGDPIVKLFGRNTDGIKYEFNIHKFRPYFYVSDESGTLKSIYGDNVRKIELKHPKEISREKEKHIEHFEADIPFARRFLIDLDITFPYVKPQILYLDFEENVETNKLISMAYKINDGEIEFVSGKENIVKELETILPRVDGLSAWNLDGYDLDWLKELFPYINFRGEYVLFDLLPLFRAAWKGGGLPSYSLDNVGMKVLGIPKLKHEKEIWELDPKDLEAYNKRDVEILYKVDQELGITDLYTFMASKLGAFVNDTFKKGTIGDFVLLKKAKEKKLILPSRPSDEVVEKRKKETYRGAFRYVEQPGLFRNVSNFDISGAYPSVLIQKNVSPELDLDKTNEQIGFLPTAVKEILKLKDNANKGSPEYKVFKESVNALYGTLGSPYSRVYSPEHAEAITQTLAAFMKGFESKPHVIYIDTDSIFFTCDEAEAAKQIADRMEECELKFSFTKERYDAIYIFGKAHYVARMGTEYIEKGIQTRRGDSPKLLQELLGDGIRKIMDGVPIFEVREEVNSKLNRIQDEPLENIAIPKGLSKKPEDYKVKPQQLRAFEYSKKHFDFQPNLRFDKINILHIKHVPSIFGLESTDVLNLPTSGLPKGYVVDYEKHKELIQQGLKFLFQEDLGDEKNEKEKRKRAFE